MRNKPLPRITTMAEEEPLHWTVEMEVSLFYAMRRHKPVGKDLKEYIIFYNLIKSRCFNYMVGRIYRRFLVER